MRNAHKYKTQKMQDCASYKTINNANREIENIQKEANETYKEQEKSDPE